MKNLKIKIFIFAIGIITGLLLSLWWQIGQREHQQELQEEIRYEQNQ